MDYLVVAERQDSLGRFDFCQASLAVFVLVRLLNQENQNVLF